jgi:subtilisin family serine protease
MVRGTDVELWQVQEGTELAVVEELSADPAVEYAEPNFVYQAFDPGPNSPNIIPNDPYYINQWAHPLMQSPAAWDISTGGSNVVIAVVDTGADRGHPDLAGKLVAGYDFVDNDSDPTDTHGHGTHVAGIAAAASNNGVGVAGMNWMARIMPVRVLGTEGSGSTADIVAGIIWAYQNGADVLSLSLGGPSYSQAMQDAVTAASGAGSLVMASMGNCRTVGPGCPDANPTNFPAAYANVMAVAATGPSDTYASYSQYGTYCDIAAPGGDMRYAHDPSGIYSTMPTYPVYMTTNFGYFQDYDYAHGTSQATPHVAGLAAMVWAMQPTLSPGEVQNTIQSTATDLGPPGWDPDYGYGRINPLAALQVAGPPLAPTLSPVTDPDGDGAYVVQWSQVPNATSYTLQQDDDPAFGSPSTFAAGSSTQYAISGNPAGSTWFYRVLASNPNGNSPWSNVEAVTIPPPVPVLNPIQNTSNEDAYTVSWSAATSATSYTLGESTSASCLGPTARYKGAALQYNVTGQRGGTWYYCVLATNAGGNSAWSSVVSTTVSQPAISPPPTLSPIDNADGDGTYDVVWSAVPTTPVTYTLEQSSEPYFVSPTVVYSGPNLTHTVTGQTGGAWYYRVRAFGQNGKSPWSASQSVTVRVVVVLPLVALDRSQETIMSEGFEGSFPNGLWHVTDVNWLLSGEYYWGKRDCRSFSGSFGGWAVGAGADGAGLGCFSHYPHYADSWMVYGPFSLADSVSAELAYQAWVSVDSIDDRLCHAASIDGNSFYGSCTSSTFPQQTWTERVFDLKNVNTLGDLTGEPDVWIALVFATDGLGSLAEGAYVDDIQLYKTVGPPTARAGGRLPDAPAPAWDTPAALTLDSWSR